MNRVLQRLRAKDRLRIKRQIYGPRPLWRDQPHYAVPQRDPQQALCLLTSGFRVLIYYPIAPSVCRFAPLGTSLRLILYVEQAWLW